ncbi:flagellin [Geotoga petraea]|uniref:Flagellin n=1 Tax=Geotoga petraea TaxID=28234 RepID=A0A4Z0VSY9_9BACT|nr:flagellin [Geotoga petraea]TGG86978.1 flagellin [Geotoga petraea]
MRINHNINAINAWRSLGSTNTAMGKTLEKLSSGLRINRAGDDAAGLAISEKMRSQIKGIDMAVKNSQDGISLIQTAEGALTETHSILQRMRELAVQSSTDTNTDVDRDQLQSEFTELKDEIDRIAKTTQFNNKNLLDGSLKGTRDGDAKIVSAGAAGFEVSAFSASAVSDASFVIEVGQFDGNTTSQIDVKVTMITAGGSSSVTTVATTGNITIGTVSINWDTSLIADISDFDGVLATNAVVDGGAAISYAKDISSADAVTLQIGANEGQTARVGFDSTQAEDLGLTSITKIDSKEDASFAIGAIDAAISKVSTFRSKLGAVQNRLEHTVSNLGVASENLTAAESRIRDADMAAEMMKFTKQQILLQSSNSMLAQANQVPQNVLQLLR